MAPNGGRYWRFNYRFKGKQKTLALGVYPDVGLAKARVRHLEARKRLVDGVDPSHERRTAGKAFEEVARQWHAHWKADRDERHAHYVLKRLEADVFPEIGSLPLADIPTSAFRDAVQKIEQRGAADIAKGCFRPAARSCATRWPTTSPLTTRSPGSSPAMC